MLSNFDVVPVFLVVFYLLSRYVFRLNCRSGTVLKHSGLTMKHAECLKFCYDKVTQKFSESVGRLVKLGADFS